MLKNNNKIKLAYYTRDCVKSGFLYICEKIPQNGPIVGGNGQQGAAKNHCVVGVAKFLNLFLF